MSDLPLEDKNLDSIEARHYAEPGIPNALGASLFGKETLALVAEVRRLRAESAGHVGEQAGVHLDGYFYFVKVDDQIVAIGFKTHEELLAWVDKDAPARGARP